MLENIARSLDLLLLAFSFGATVWFFFVQSPVLVAWMDKERFLPIQMRLTAALFRTLAVSVTVMFGLSMVHAHEQLWLHALTAGVAMFGALMNNFIVVPKALRAGGRALRNLRGSNETDRSVADFASRGGGDASKVWHRLVVVFVVVMLGGLVGHGVVLDRSWNAAHSSGSEHVVVGDEADHGREQARAAGDEAGDEAAHGVGHEGVHGAGHGVGHGTAHESARGEERAQADAATKRNVGELHEVVRRAIAEGTEPGAAAAEVHAAYQQIFLECEMTGQAHDHLHHFLVPIGAEIEQLKAGDAAALERLDGQLARFDEQFR